MGILDSFGKQLSDTFDSLREKSHRSAVINRLHIVIKNERENSARAYVALGKYYYEHLREQGNAETEALCASIDDSDRRMKRAFAHMDEIREKNIANVQDTECANCDDDCSVCKFHEDCDSEAAAYDPYDTTPSSIAQDPDNVETDEFQQTAVAAPHTETSAPTAPAQPEPAVTPADEEAAPEEPQA